MSDKRFSVSFNPPNQDAPEAVFTGERFLPHLSGEIAWEHLHRYSCAVEVAGGLDVLDIACGEGYGSYILSQVAKSVLGVDIDGPTVQAASTKYVSANLQFKEGSCYKIPAPDASIDLVASFETIEHVSEHEAFLEELLRVMRPDGALLISSPERDAYQVSRGANKNQFHEKELSFDELESLLKKRFKHVQLNRQLPLFGSFLAPCDGAASNPSVRVMSLRNGSIDCADKLTRGPYVIGLCCRSELRIKLSASLFDPQLPFNLLSALEGGIRERDAQLKADSAQISQLLGVVRREEGRRRVRNESLARASLSQESLVSSALDDYPKSEGARDARETGMKESLGVVGVSGGSCGGSRWT